MRTATMPSATRPASAGSLCLDLAATADERAGRVVDQLTDVAALSAWFAATGLPEPVGGLTPADLAAACELRTAISGLAGALIGERPPDPAAVRTLNGFAGHPTPVFLLRASGRDKVAIEEVDAAAALAVVARDAVNLLAGPDLARLRACDGCGALFYDRSPSGRRRWCSMQRCGERVASASYRRRQAMIRSV